MTETKNTIKNMATNILLYAAFGGAISVYGIWGKVVFDRNVDEKHKEVREGIKIKYINDDSMPDLVYETEEIYLQTKKGKFVSYNEVIEKEKYKLDSIYQVKQDYIKDVFRNKLEKEVLK